MATPKTLVVCTVALVILLLSASLLLFSSANKPMPGYLDFLRDAGIVVGALLICYFGVAFWSRDPHILPGSLILTWETFALTCGISSALNHSLLEDSIELFWLFFAVPLVLFLFGSTVLRHVGFKVLLWAMAIAHGIIILISLVHEPTLRFRYQGLLGDPNQLGMLSLMVGLLVIYYLPIALDRIWLHRWKLTFLIALLVAIVSLVIISSHRTSLLTLAVCLVVSVGRFPRVRLKGLLLIVPIVLIFWGLLSTVDEGGQILNQLIDKHSSSLAKGEMLDGREVIWQFALQDITAFGHGRGYFINNTNRLGAHNSFLHVLGTRGLVAAAILVILCVQSLYYAFRLCRDRTLDYDSSQGPLIVISAYWLLSMAEGMFGSLGNGIHIAFLITLGYAGNVIATRRQRLRGGTTRAICFTNQ